LKAYRLVRGGCLALLACGGHSGGGTPDSGGDKCPAWECPNGGPCCPFGRALDPDGCESCTCAQAPGCSSDECSTPPPVIPLCDGNPVGAYVCEREAGGACAFKAVCPGDSCPTEQCGAKYICAACVPPGRETFLCERGLDHKCGWRLSCMGLEGPCGMIRDRSACEGDGRCRWLEPGCAGADPVTAGCYDRADLGCARGSDCSKRRICVQRAINPCLSSPSPDAGACAACATPLTICL
jgi:hypothetical protein